MTETDIGIVLGEPDDAEIDFWTSGGWGIAAGLITAADASAITSQP